AFIREEGARDLFGLEAEGDAEGERNLGRPGQGRVTAQENKAKLVIDFGRRQIQSLSLVTLERHELPLGPKNVDNPIVRHAKEPALKVRVATLVAPSLHRPEACVLDRVLNRGELLQSKTTNERGG